MLTDRPPGAQPEGRPRTRGPEVPLRRGLPLSSSTPQRLRYGRRCQSADALPLVGREAPTVECHRVARALRALLEGLARPCAVTVLLDDVHRADPASADVIALLAHGPPRAVCCWRRPPGPGSHRAWRRRCTRRSARATLSSWRSARCRARRPTSSCPPPWARRPGRGSARTAGDPSYLQAPAGAGAEGASTPITSAGARVPRAASRWTTSKASGSPGPGDGRELLGIGSRATGREGRACPWRRTARDLAGGVGVEEAVAGGKDESALHWDLICDRARSRSLGRSSRAATGAAASAGCSRRRATWTSRRRRGACCSRTRSCSRSSSRSRRCASGSGALGADGLALLAAVLAVAVVAKLSSASAASAAAGLPRAEALTVGALMNARAFRELVVLGRRRGRARRRAPRRGARARGARHEARHGGAHRRRCPHAAGGGARPRRDPLPGLPR